MKHICIRKCYWEERIWDLGDVVEKPNDAKVPEHFHPVTPEVVSPLVVDAAKDEAANIEPPPDDGDGSIVKETLKKLCAKNGITVKSKSTIAWMREQLSEKGIVVS